MLSLPPQRPRRSQAALFDGIMFLLFTSVSMVMVFAFLGNYGVAEDQTLRSAYQLAYMDSVGKSLYHIHANALSDAVPDHAANAVDYDWQNGYCRHGGSCEGDDGKPYAD